MVMVDLYDTVIIGGGQAGLAMSYHLSQAGRDHIVVERARIAESWRSERWDSLMFQFPNWSIKLPGHAFSDGTPDGFATKETVANFIEDYARLIRAPVQCDLNVLSLGFDDAIQRFVIHTQTSQLQAMNVIIATGSYHSPVVPKYASSISHKVYQIHTRDYKNPQQLPLGNTLIVGSGASGTQIAEELLQKGVSISPSAVMTRFPVVTAKKTSIGGSTPWEFGACPSKNSQK
jgi:putative flavoprotein involved in K+ transport